MKNKIAIFPEYIAYEGDLFIVEWYYDSRMRSPAFEYFNELTSVQQDKTLELIKIIGDVGKILNKEKFNFEGDKLFVLKPSPDRFFCFFHTGGKLIITNAYKKQSQKMPPREKERALKLKYDYIARCDEGTYYEEAS